MAVSPKLIERREYKYLIDEVTAARVRGLIRPFCVLDPFAADQPNHQYTIRSLYLDTPNLALHRANEQEVRDRFKLRVRTYPGVEGAPAYFEVKRRYFDVIVKERARVSSQWPELLEGIPDPSTSSETDPGLQSFVSMVRSHGCRPVVLVEYEREPYASTIDDYARITLDRRIRCQPALGSTLEADEGRWRCVDGSEDFHDARALTVLELKFTERVPSWMVNMVQTLELDRRAFSKYGRSVRSWWEDHPMERTPRHRGRR